jgi:hypothetical protein
MTIMKDLMYQMLPLESHRVYLADARLRARHLSGLETGDRDFFGEEIELHPMAEKRPEN